MSGKIILFIIAFLLAASLPLQSYGSDIDSEDGYVKDAVNLQAYDMMAQWNRVLKRIVEEQDRVTDPGLPHSMQHASTCNHKAARALDNYLSSHYSELVTEINAYIGSGKLGVAFGDVDAVQGAFTKTNRAWRSVFVKLFSKFTIDSSQLPTLQKITRILADDITLMYVSIFMPPSAAEKQASDSLKAEHWSNVELTPHVGPSKGVIRYHFGVSIPDGDTGLEIEGSQYKWENGKGVIWDDTLLHSAWNRCNEPRIVIFVDLLRELPPELDARNRAIFAEIEKVNHVKSSQEVVGAVFSLKDLIREEQDGCNSRNDNNTCST
jgi:hypothetical protein